MPTSSDGQGLPPVAEVHHVEPEDRCLAKRSLKQHAQLGHANVTSPGSINIAEPFSPFIPDDKRASTSRRPVYIWSIIDISNLSPTTQYLVIAAGVLLFFIAYGYLQEKVTGTFKKDDVHLGWFMTSVQFLVYTCFTFMQTSLTNNSKAAKHAQNTNQDCAPKRPPLRHYALIGTLSVMSMGLSNTSCEYLSYPTQVMFKCSKLIPVMIVGVFMLNKRYKHSEYLASILISIGLINLSLADHQSSANFDYRGIIPISLSLCAGAFIGNFQEKLYREYCPTEGEMIFYTKGCGFVGLLLIIVVTGQLQLGLQYSMKNPSIVGNIVLLAMSGVLGEYFIMLLTRLFGALVTVTTTSCRKALTLYLSFILFPKPFTHKHFISCACIFMGIFLNVYSKNHSQVNEMFVGLRRAITKKLMISAVGKSSDNSVDELDLV